MRATPRAARPGSSPQHRLWRQPQFWRQSRPERRPSSGRLRRMALAVVGAALVLGAVATGCAGGGHATAGRQGSAGPARAGSAGDPADAFVTVAGGRLELAGKPWRFTGINVWNANTPADDSRYGCGEPVDLEEVAPALGNGVQVVRTWFFQRLATSLDGRRDWSTFDRTIAAAKSRGLRIVATLGNQWPQCEGFPTYQAGYKTQRWYQTGYRSAPPPGQPDSYRAWVREAVTRYRDEPAIAMWQLMNEAEDATAYHGPCAPNAAATLHSFVQDMVTLVKSVDPHHLVSVGTVGAGQCGAAADEYATLHAIDGVDVLEYHDYSPAPVPGDRWNGLAERLRQSAALHKPLIVGEMGVAPREAGGIPGRAALVDRKIGAQLQAGVAGVLLWTWRGNDSGDGYDILPGDPVLGVLARALDPAPRSGSAPAS
ncbi:Cellulase (glycosyl hydrolase family 5) [Frankia torreyi]|uniref:mannan endo-1,4-beta-mannosidase n=1 Tax=Frankia torreyi TaxID=1856 RepID=A0A0D8BLR0_9ACTN|nr:MULTISPECIES: cellulase family glycosylhydrolase [Frankia]KJE25071.1 Cellulase (glycosyl hydrolase family 5) [Frankia torreyi]